LGQARTVSTNFWQQQLTYARVQAAYARCWPTLAARLQAQHLDPTRLEVFFRLIKTTRVLEVWGRNQGQADAAFQLLRQYPLAATSGTLGPKRYAGDAQVPEGFYHINRFNPLSLFHLSLGLDYPNADDAAYPLPTRASTKYTCWPLRRGPPGRRASRSTFSPFH
jgi:murein L,D-transpeptidase YafK